MDATRVVVAQPRLIMKTVAQVLYRAALAWNRDNAMRLSAAVAMYTLLSLSPLLVITIKVVGLALSDEAAKVQVHRQIESLLGPAGAQAADGMIATSVRPETGIVMTVVSAVLLLVAASGVFNELRDALNTIWNLSPNTKRGIRATIRNRLLSVGLVLVLGFLLLVSHVLTVTLTVVSEHLLGKPGWVAVIVDLVASTLLFATLFGLLFRVLPDARLDWSDVLFGSVVTAILFKVGQYLQALYFTHSASATAYGAAGSIMIVLLWVYYSCWVFFYGAELIQERVRLLGREISPTPDANHLPKACKEDPELKQQHWLDRDSDAVQPPPTQPPVGANGTPAGAQ